MSTRLRSSAVLFALWCAFGLHLNAWAQASAATPRPAVPKESATATPAEPASPQAAEKTERGEPAVRRTVVEDDGARIDELKVRGQTKRITVTPKKGGKPYEIIPPGDGPDHSQGPNGSNGAVGKRVWPVLSF